MMDEAVVRIFRFDPSRDKEPRYDTYRVPFDPDAFVLDVVSDIYENLDGTLAFRRFKCGKGLCTSCAMRVNGRTVMACNEKMQREIQIDPIRGSVIRDLVVSDED